jgi:2-dehydropantoate 2-reductase
VSAPTVAVLGPGGVGAFVAAALDRAGLPVTLVAREATAEALRSGGVHVTSRALDADWVARPQVATEVAHPVDVLLVATKAVGLADALSRVEPDAPGLVVPLLNGLDHMTVLRERFGSERVRAGVVRVQSDRPHTGRVVQDSAVVRIDVAGPVDGRVEALAGALESAGFGVVTGATEADVLWAKLARLCPLACVTSAFDATLGEVLADPSRASALAAAVGEVVAVAGAEGASLDADVVRGELAGLRPDQSSSMARDIAAGRPAEIDAIPGAVLRAADRHDLACPAIRYLVARIEERATPR